MEDTDIMSALFSGKIGTEGVIHNEPKRVELGHGIGIGTKGSYSQYVQKMAGQSQKGNGIIYLGKDVIKENDVYVISGQTDKFSPDDVPMLLILYYNVLKDIRIKTSWKDSDNDVILEQFYDIPSAHSNNYDWWSVYSVYFIGPENLDYGDYGVEITSYQLGYDNKITTYNADVKFSIEDTDESNEANQDNIEKVNIEEVDIEEKNESKLEDKLENLDIGKINQLSKKDQTLQTPSKVHKQSPPEEKVKPLKKTDEEVDVYEAFGMK